MKVGAWPLGHGGLRLAIACDIGQARDVPRAGPRRASHSTVDEIPLDAVRAG
jgi:hypothetical protein